MWTMLLSQTLQEDNIECRVHKYALATHWIPYNVLGRFAMDEMKHQKADTGA